MSQVTIALRSRGPKLPNRHTKLGLSKKDLGFSLCAVPLSVLCGSDFRDDGGAKPSQRDLDKKGDERQEVT